MTIYNNDLIIGIVLVCFSFLYTIPIIGASFSIQKGYLSSWNNLKYFLSGNVSKNFQHSPALIVQFFVGLVFVVGIVMLGLGVSQQSVSPSIDGNPVVDPVSTISTNNLNLSEKFANSTQQMYKTIGYGPAMDTVKIQNWLQGSAGSMGLNLTSSNSAWPDGNGVPISIPTDQFKQLYGFIPPSFSYYPKGQETNDYNATNYQSGREDCMKACSYTDCIAVQTEVPENCSQQAPATGTGNTCGTNSAFSCTLFYNDISSADDAYWTLGNGSLGNYSNSPGCFENTGSACIGKKYYEDSSTPATLPNKGVKPSSANVKFCDPSVNVTNTAGYGIVANTCSCNGPVGGDGCNDPNCCVMRPIITTEYIQNSHPYYALPINVSKAINVKTGDYSMVVPTITYKNGTPTNCGIVGSSSSPSLSSCTQNGACSSASDTSNCWIVDTNSVPKCTGNTFDQSSGSGALSTFQNNGANNYDDLFPSCYYRQKLTTVQPIQFNCDPTVVTRGCIGSPPIIQTSELTNSGGFTACSDTNTLTGGILSINRCQNNPGSLASCTGFPYSCGSNNGSSRLWIRV